jgi:hypothetical protein
MFIHPGCATPFLVMLRDDAASTIILRALGGTPAVPRSQSRVCRIARHADDDNNGIQNVAHDAQRCETECHSRGGNRTGRAFFVVRLHGETEAQPERSFRVLSGLIFYDFRDGLELRIKSGSWFRRRPHVCAFGL